MVAVFTGLGLGVERGSGFLLGGNGQLGSSTFGRYGENVYVNAANGNLSLQRTDEILTGVGADLAFGRNYNSQGPMTDENGDNWRLSASRSVNGLTGAVNTAGSTVKRIDWDGSDTLYTWDATRNAYIGKQQGDSFDKLTFNSSTNVWTWTDGATNTVEAYANGSAGRITSSKDAAGNTTTFTYTGTLLTKVTMSDGEFVSLTYTGNNLKSVATFGKTSSSSSAVLVKTLVSYTYDASNRLATVTTDLTPEDNSVADGNAVTTAYTYDGTSRRVASISQTGGARLDITYVQVGSTFRVASLSQAQASGVSSVTSFSYDTTNQVTTVTDNSGQQTKLTYDGQGHLTRLETPAGVAGGATAVSIFAYNADGSVTSATDPLGNTTTYSYDTNGNLILKQDALGNTIASTYDGNNRILTETHYLVTDPDGAGPGTYSQGKTTRYAYNTNGTLAFIISPEGRVTQFTYNSSALLSRKTLYVSQYYNVSGLNDNNSISLSLLNNWVSGISDKSDSEVITYFYDFRGNLSSTQTPGAVSRDGSLAGFSGATFYTYDQSGNILSIKNFQTVVSTVQFDGLNRIILSTDINKGESHINYNDATNSQTETVVDGTTTINIYDFSGELISSAVSGSASDAPVSQSGYAYDDLGRLRMETDALGNNIYHLYDLAGRKVADIASDGQLTEYVYDADDRVTRTIAYTTRLTSTQIASLVDAQGRPASVDLASVKPTSSTNDHVNWTIYDAAGRVVETINANGNATIFSYDGTSQITSQTRYYQALDVVGLKAAPPSEILLPTADTRDATSRSFYDKDGNLIATLAPNGVLSEIAYGAAGQKTRTVSHATLVDASLRGSGTLAQLLTSAGTSLADQRVDFFYDNVGRIRLTIDGAGQILAYSYDFDGNINYKSIYNSGLTIKYQYTTDDLSNIKFDNPEKSTTYYYQDDKLRAIEDASGKITTYAYNDAGIIIETHEFVNQPDYDSDDPSLYDIGDWIDNPKAHASSDDRITRVYTDSAGRPVYSVDAAGYVTETRYDADWRVSSVIRYPAVYTVDDTTTTAGLAAMIDTAATGRVVTQTTYDADGRVDTITDTKGTVTKFTYDAYDQVVDTTVAYGTTDAVTTHRTYDAGGRVATVTLASGTAIAATTSYTYDAFGNVLTITDPRGNTTTNTYDTLGQLISVTDPIGATTTYQWDAFGNRVKTTDARGNSSYSYYDVVGRLTLQIDKEGYATATTYGIGTEVESITHYATRVATGYGVGDPPALVTAAGDATTQFTVDLMGRVTRVTDAEGNYEDYTLDAFGDRIQVRNKLGGITTNTFDHRGLLITETLPKTAINAQGVVEATTVTNRYEYDSRGNRTKATEAAGLAEERVTRYAYDELDHLIFKISDTVTSRNADGSSSTGHPVETYNYDRRGNLIEYVSPSGARTLHYYDAADNEVAQVNPLGQLTVNTFDLNGNRLSTKTYGDAVALPGAAGGTPPAPVNASNFRLTEYQYDNNNRLINTINRSVDVFDKFNKTISDIVSSITYDAAGNIVLQTDARGNQTFFFYDKNGHKVGQIDQENYVTTYALDADGNVLTETRYANRYTGLASQGADLAAITSAIGTSSDDRTTQFTYDRDGRRLTETRLNLVASTVGTNGGLTTVTTNATIRYTYNALGLVTSKTEANGDETDYTFDSMGRMTEIQKAAYLDYNGNSVRPTTDMQYDGNDQLVRQIVRGVDNSTEADDRITRYQYDKGGHVVSTTDPAGVVTTFAYDAAGRLALQSYTRKKSDGTTVVEGNIYAYDLADHQVSQQKAIFANNVWTTSQSTDLRYDIYGEMVARGINTGGDVSKYQEFADYDALGRVWRTNFGDGITKAYAYDANGNATLLLQVTGTADLRSMSLAQMVAPNSGVTQTISIFDKRNQLIETIQPSIENAANLPDAINAFDTQTPGANYLGGTPSITNGSITTDPGVAASNTGSLVASGAGTLTADVQVMGGSWIIKFTVTANTIYGTGAIHVCDVNGTLLAAQPIPVPANGAPTFLTLSGPSSRNYYLFQDLPNGAGKVQIGRVDSVGSVANQRVIGTIGRTVQVRNSPGASLTMFARPSGSSGPYTRVAVNALPGNIYAIDATNLASFAAASPPTWEIKYFSITNGAIVDSRAATLSFDGAGNPTVSGDHGVQIGGTGKAMLINDNGTQRLLLSEPPAGTTSIQYAIRPQGSNSALIYNNSDSTLFSGFYAVTVNGLTGTSDIFLKEGSPNQNMKFTYTAGSQPGTPGRITDTVVRISQNSGATALRLWYKAAGSSSEVPVDLTLNGANWTWTPDPSISSGGSYTYRYQATNGSGQVVNAASGQITFGSSPSATSTPDISDTKIVFSPPQSAATRLVLSYRLAGSTNQYQQVSLSKSNGVFTWDVESMKPSSGTKNLEFFYDVYNSSNVLLTPAGGQQHATGYLMIGSDRSTTVRQLEWVLSPSSDPAAIIDRKQGYNAFGEITTETDGLGHTTDLSYNVIGKLIKKQDPFVTDVAENGTSSQVRPTTLYYYDLAGRLVGVEDTYHHQNTMHLLAGTGEDGTDAITIDEFHADNGQRHYKTDIFGDVRTVTDELGAVTQNSYDADGRLTQVIHPTRVGGNSNGVFLTDTYGYDELGQRIRHSAGFGGQTQSETTDYDVLGRVARTVDLAGNAITYGYTWSPTLVSSGTAGPGGWVKTITQASGLQSSESDDYFGHIVAKTDLGGHTFTYSYNRASELVLQTGSTGQHIAYLYYGNGYIRSITDTATNVVSTFEYDKEGNRTLEQYQTTDLTVAGVTYQAAHVRYDALNRIIEIKDPKADITYSYDANNNRREVKSVYSDGIDGSKQTQDYWYAYDSMNRFVVTMGQLVNGVVDKGATGVRIAYNAANERVSAANADGTTEYYTYTADGYLEDTSISDGSHTNPVLRARRVNDALGRVTTYTEYGWDSTVNFVQQSTYDGENRVTDQTVQTRTGGTLVTSNIHNDYRADVGGGVYTGADQGVLIHSRQTQGSTTQDTRYTYQYWDEAKQTLIQVSANGGGYVNAQGASQLSYDVNGHLVRAQLTGGTIATINYTNDAYGQVMIREQSNGGVLSLRQLYYYFDGNRIGDVGNNGPTQVDYATALAQRGVTKTIGEFRYGRPVASADFDENYQPIGPNYPGQAASQYTVRGGDSLTSIAQAVWGDSSLWYLIADANGLGGGDTLVAGQILIIPNKVTNIHNRAGVYRVYDPGEAIGDALPTIPTLAAQPVPAAHHHGCGIAGQILLTVVAVAVTAVAGPIAGDLASQAVGVLTGIQDKFNFKEFALTVITAGVASGVEASGLASAIGAEGVGASIVNAVVTNAVSQGVGVTTGLQDHFSWGSVAAAGVTAGVSGAVHINAKTQLGQYVADGLSRTAAAIAATGAQSLITGTDFGDNLRSALPSVLAQTIGNVVGDQIAGRGSRFVLGVSDAPDDLTLGQLIVDHNLTAIDALGEAFDSQGNTRWPKGSDPNGVSGSGLAVRAHMLFDQVYEGEQAPLVLDADGNAEEFVVTGHRYNALENVAIGFGQEVERNIDGVLSLVKYPILSSEAIFDTVGKAVIAIDQDPSVIPDTISAAVQHFVAADAAGREQIIGSGLADAVFAWGTEGIGEFGTGAAQLARAGRVGDIAAESEASVVWNNGWRTADGKFASPVGTGRAGGSAEAAVWDAVEAKPGWNVVRGQVAVRDASGQLRYYDGAAISPRGRVIGLETKSGTAIRAPEQRLFDSTLNSSPSNVARGVGQSKGITVQRSTLIRVP